MTRFMFPLVSVITIGCSTPKFDADEGPSTACGELALAVCACDESPIAVNCEDATGYAETAEAYMDEGNEEKFDEFELFCNNALEDFAEAGGCTGETGGETDADADAEAEAADQADA